MSLPPDPDADLKAACNKLVFEPDGSNERQRELLETILAQAPSTIEGHRLRARAVLVWRGGVGSDGEPVSEFNRDDIWPLIRNLIGQDTIDAVAARTRACRER